MLYATIYSHDSSDSTQGKMGRRLAGLAQCLLPILVSYLKNCKCIPLDALFVPEAEHKIYLTD